MQALVAGPRSHLTEAVVLDALSLAHHPRIQWGVQVLTTDDELTDLEVPAVSGSVTWSYRPPSSRSTRAAAEVRRRADLTLAGALDLDLLAYRFRPWAEIQASTGEWVRWHLGVFVATTPGTNDDGVVLRWPLKLADKTWLWAHRNLTDPVTVTAGTNAVQWVKDRLASVFGETSYAITTSPVVVDEDKTYEAGMSELAMMNAVLELAAFDALTTTEDGLPRSVPLEALANMGVERAYGPGAGKVLTEASVDPLEPSLPNVARFVARQGPSLPEEGNGIVTVRNQSTGPGSIDSRGAEVHETVDVEAENQTELEAIAAAEAQRLFAGGGRRLQLQVGWCPAHSDRDVIGLDKPRLGLSGTWLVTEWTLPLAEKVTDRSAVLMSMTAEQRVVVT